MDIKRAIGMFDSGIGGLSVLKKATRELKNENYIYLCDSKRVPYGVRSEEEVLSLTLNSLDYLYSRGVKALVIACNTATSCALNEAIMKYDVPVMGVINAAVKDAIEKTKNKNIALIATEATVNKGIYNDKFKSLDEEISLISVAAPDLVTIIENGKFIEEDIYRVILDYLKEIDDFCYDTLILGCTHFPLVKDIFENALKNLGKSVELIDPAQSVVESLKEILSVDDMLNDDGNNISFNTTGDINKFKNSLEKLIDVSSYNLKFNEVDLG